MKDAAIVEIIRDRRDVNGHQAAVDCDTGEPCLYSNFNDCDLPPGKYMGVRLRRNAPMALGVPIYGGAYQVV